MCCVRLESFSISSISEAAVEKKSSTIGRKNESKIYLLKDIELVILKSPNILNLSVQHFNFARSLNFIIFPNALVIGTALYIGADVGLLEVNSQSFLLSF